jgi:hypothetical protein
MFTVLGCNPEKYYQWTLEGQQHNLNKCCHNIGVMVIVGICIWFNVLIETYVTAKVGHSKILRFSDENMRSEFYLDQDLGQTNQMQSLLPRSRTIYKPESLQWSCYNIAYFYKIKLCTFLHVKNTCLFNKLLLIYLPETRVKINYISSLERIVSFRQEKLLRTVAFSRNQLTAEIEGFL